MNEKNNCFFLETLKKNQLFLSSVQNGIIIYVPGVKHNFVVNSFTYNILQLKHNNSVKILHSAHGQYYCF